MATQVNDDPDGGQVCRSSLLYLIAATIDMPLRTKTDRRRVTASLAWRLAADENLQPTTGVFPVSADGIERLNRGIVPILSMGWLLPRPLRVSG